MDNQSARQQIVEKIKDSSNILVTVSESPTVDELSAALGLTLMLNKMNKHGTAVFSGTIPAAIRFLEPDKTFEDTVDSLRDFIIALNKDKADHLRYKVDGDVVKIFITPYRTTINDKDLEFSQGDYNVELVLALGVKSQDNLDKALESHGRIFHDATVATISAGSETSNLGSIDWGDHSASSLSEMLVGLSDAIKSDKSLLDDRIATAFLTGIVAKTDRFSNNLTSSKVMTVAAELMAAGANQQLIAAKLEEANEISDPGSKNDGNVSNSDGSTDLSEGQSTKVSKVDTPSEKPEDDKKNETDTAKKKKKDGNGELSISHEMAGDVDEVARQTNEENQDAAALAAEEELRKQTGNTEPSVEEKPNEGVDDTASKSPEEELAAHLEQTAGTNTPSVADLQKDLQSAASDVDQAAEHVDKSELTPAVSVDPEREPDEPSLGGTLNATTEEAADEKRREESSDRNHTILSHGGSSYMGNGQPTYNTPLNSTVDPMNQDDQKPLGDPMAEQTNPTAPLSRTITPPTSGMTLAQIDSENRVPHEQARNDIEAAYAAATDSQQPAELEPSPQEPLAPAMPPMPDFSTLPPLPPMPPAFGSGPNQPAPMSQPADDLSQPQQGVYSSPQSEVPSSNPFVAPTTIQPAPQPVSTSSDPGQFKIPGA